MTKKCLFCKIIAGEIEEIPLWQNRDFVAYLDRNPNMEGVTMVMPKKHYGSDVFDLDNQFLVEFIIACKEVAQLLERTFKVKRVALVAEGMGIDHAHIKLYPLPGLRKKFEEKWAPQRIYFTKYQGYLTTVLGPEVSREELKKMAIKFKNSIGYNKE